MTIAVPAPRTGRRGGGLRRLFDVIRMTIAIAACVLIAGSLGVLGKLIIDPNGSEEFTVGRRPTLFNQLIDNEDRLFLDSTYGEVMGVAHNSGGSIEATLEAITFGADVIEVDVVKINGSLYSAHTPPLPFIGQRFFRGPSLERIWLAAYRADALKLDLKETDPDYVRLVADFLVSRPIDRDIIVASRSPSVLITLRQHAPEATLLLSVPDEPTFSGLQDSDVLLRNIDGVTARESIIDPEMALWLSERDKQLFAWTVNDIERANELIQFGVTGITTENLALLTLFDAQP